MTDVYEGLPTLSLLPLANTRFKVVGSTKIILPREGSYYKLSPKVFSEEHGDFKVLDNNVLYLPSITKVLLATNNYPRLKQNQIFSPYSFEFTDDSVIIQGSVLEILSVEATKDETD